MTRKRKADPKARLIPKIRPEEPEARDEGPRLLPIREHSVHDPSFAQSNCYLEIADQAIHGSKKKK